MYVLVITSVGHKGCFRFISTWPEGQVAYKCGNIPSACVITNLILWYCTVVKVTAGRLLASLFR